MVELSISTAATTARRTAAAFVTTFVFWTSRVPIVRALRYLLSGGQSRAMNLANSRGYSVKNVIAAAEKVCGRRIKSRQIPRREGDPPVLVGASETAHTLLGWKPARSELELQIKDAWNWFSKPRQPG
jgi:UDP-glucose 4-epimerase